LCGFLLVVVILEPYFLAGGGARGGAARLLQHAACHASQGASFLQGDAVSACFL